MVIINGSVIVIDFMDHDTAIDSAKFGPESVAGYQQASTTNQGRGMLRLLSDLYKVVWSPGQLFGQLPVSNRWVSALMLLLILQAGLGIALVTTGVRDYEMDVQTQKAVSQLYQLHQGGDGQELSSLVTLAEQTGEFNKMVARLVTVLGPPGWSLFQLGILTGVLFVFVAVCTGKPNSSLLAGIVTFALWTQIPRMVVQVALISQLQLSRVETSLAALASDPTIGLPGYLLLRQVDPFALWFWFLVGLGLSKTGQLTTMQAWRTVVFLALVGAGLAMLGDVVTYAEMPQWKK